MNRFVESKEEVKRVVDILEKEALLLNLMPITFNDELEKDVQHNNLFMNTKDSINIIWDFILISFRFYREAFTERLNLSLVFSLLASFNHMSRKAV